MTHQILRWEALEHEHIERSADWYWALWIIVISIAITAIILDNTLLAVFILLSAAALCMMSAKRPRVIVCEINEHGVLFSKNLYPFSSIESFWVEDRSEYGRHSRLLLKSKAALAALVIIPTGAVATEEIRELLLPHLPEEELQESLPQMFMEYLGF